MVAVEGRLFTKWFPAAPNLAYDFVWDKADVYSQKVYGLSEAFGERSRIYCICCLGIYMFTNSGFVSDFCFPQCLWVLSMSHVQT